MALRCTISDDRGRGGVHIDDDYDTTIDHLWDALTQPDRLARWYGQVDGDFRQHGRITIRIEPADLDSVGTVQTCEPPLRLVVRMRETDASASRGRGPTPFDQVVEARLTTVDEHRTHLMLRISGFPLDRLPAYGAGWHLDIMRLTADLGHTEPADVSTQWATLVAAYP